MEARLAKLYEMGYQIERKEQPFENRMEEIMFKKRITSATLVKMTGISKQTMHALLSGKMKPGIDLVLKIATVLNVSVEEIFSLNESAWETLITNEGKSVYWDLAEMEIVERPDAKKHEDEQGIEYWNLEANRLVSESEYQTILEKALEERMTDELEKARKEKVRRRDEKVFQRMARQAIEKDVEQRYPLRFQRVVKSIKPQSIL